MKEKLSNDEIEQRKKENMLESAKMNSCISDIPLSDLIDSTFNRGNYGDKDCMVKQQFLKNLVEPVTSRQLYDTLKHQGYSAKYSTFKGLLYRYQKYEYVVKLNDKKPFIYGLTELGYQHIKNPYLARQEMARQRLNFIYGQIEKELVDHPEALKALLESITQMNIGSPIGSSVVVSNSVSNYSADDIGSNEEYIQSVENKIFNPEFFKNADPEKLKVLADGILGSPISQEDKEYLLIAAIQEAIKSNKGSMILQKSCNPSKKDIPKYYDILIRCINKPLKKDTFKEFPFTFYKINNKNEIRLKSKMEANLYGGNEDATEIDFDIVNKVFFQNQMVLKTKLIPEKRVIQFYCVGRNRSDFMMEMSYSDYEKALKKTEKQTLKINVN